MGIVFNHLFELGRKNEVKSSRYLFTAKMVYLANTGPRNMPNTFHSRRLLPGQHDDPGKRDRSEQNPPPNVVPELIRRRRRAGCEIKKERQSRVGNQSAECGKWDILRTLLAPAHLRRPRRFVLRLLLRELPL